jgi:1-aminocyclopropane-1-carboxylate deaminase/D-cysteine desulfhydrase-like pyridoxal-dependent ACC family enzyme
VSKEDYVRLGSPRLGEILTQKVRGTEGNKPYFIPVGGSNGLGTWGYLECFEEMMQQAPAGEMAFTDIVVVPSSLPPPQAGCLYMEVCAITVCPSLARF